MQLMSIPTHLDHRYNNTCWLVALATFLQISFYEAVVLMFGGPRIGDLGITLSAMGRRLRKLGFVPARKDYRRAYANRLLVGCFRSRRGYFHTLHAVVWDHSSHSRLDPCDYDTFMERRAVVVRAFRRLPNAKPMTTGVRWVPRRWLLTGDSTWRPEGELGARSPT